MQKLTATLDVLDSAIIVIQDMAKANGMTQADFLAHCLARGLLLVEHEYNDAHNHPAGSAILNIAIDDDIPL